MRKHRIIIIDDEEISADGINMLIEQSGMPVDVMRVFYSSIEALHYLQENQVDIVITDISMPELSGLELIEKMKNTNDRMLFIILTGYGSLEYAKQAMRYGVRHFLQKPCSPKELTESIAECMEESDRRSQERFLRLKEVMKRQILNHNIPEDEQKLAMDSFQILMYEERYYDRIHADLEELLTGREYSFSNIKGTMVYYVDHSSPLLEELRQIAVKYRPLRIVICYCDAQSALTVQDIFKQGRKMFQYGFYISESCVINTADIREESTGQPIRLEIPFSNITKLLENNDFLSAEEEFEKLLETCKERKIPPEKLLEQMESFCRKWIGDFKIEKEATAIGIIKKIISTVSCNDLKECMKEIISLLEQKEENKYEEGSISAKLNLIIEKQYAENELSLKWISQHLLYLNPDYMG